MANHTPNPLADRRTISRAANNGDPEQTKLAPVPRARKLRGQAGPLTAGVARTPAMISIRSPSRKKRSTWRISWIRGGLPVRFLQTPALFSDAVCSYLSRKKIPNKKYQFFMTKIHFQNLRSKIFDKMLKIFRNFKIFILMLMNMFSISYFDPKNRRKIFFRPKKNSSKSQ